jgi:predicted DNA-binding transcriptional regulator
MHGLNPILGKSSHLRVLRVLYRAREKLCGREIERRCGLSNRAVMLALEELASRRVLCVETTSTAYFYSPNPANYLWSKALRPALESEELFWEDLRKLVRRVVIPRPEAAMVTGALAREEGADSGTLDIHLLYAAGRERLQAYRCLERLREQVLQRYALDTVCTFMDMRNMDDPEFQALWNRIAREGVLLFGKLP